MGLQDLVAPQVYAVKAMERSSLRRVLAGTMMTIVALVSKSTNSVVWGTKLSDELARNCEIVP